VDEQALAAVEIRAINSINHISESDRGAVVVASSHGGLYSAYKAVTAGVRAVILSDAGGGLEDAGIASLEFCGSYGIPAAVVSHMSARIGDVADMRARGIISKSNAAAGALGIVAGMTCSQAISLFAAAPPTAPATPGEVAETRHEELLVEGTAPVICIDSASLIRDEDAGRIVITGSHGGLIGGDPAKAINVACAFAAFNDAGVGIDEAGTGRLKPLDERGIAAVTVGHMSARIGDGRSTLRQGIITHANSAAIAMGARPGVALSEMLSAWLVANRN